MTREGKHTFRFECSCGQSQDGLIFGLDENHNTDHLHCACGLVWQITARVETEETT